MTSPDPLFPTDNFTGLNPFSREMTARLNSMGEVVYRFEEIEEALITMLAAKRDYYPVGGGGGSSFFTAVITGSSPAGTNKWTYTAEKLSADGTSSGTAVGGTITNLAEALNSGTIINHGQNIASDANSEITVSAIASGSEVPMWKRGSEHVFYASPNPITVTCIQAAGQGACCDSGPPVSCTDTTQAACTGTWLSGVSCSTNPCGGGSGGACCHPDGSCTDVADAAACTGAGGTYQGDGTLCSDPGVSCPPAASGACCQAQQCSIGWTASTCAGVGGTYQGDGSDCGPPNPCVVLIGACCSDNGCTVGTALDCLSRPNGVYQGDFTDCGPPNPCGGGTPTGACCCSGLDGQTCVDNQTQSACVASGGSYMGDNTACGSVSCPLCL